MVFLLEWRDPLAAELERLAMLTSAPTLPKTSTHHRSLDKGFKILGQRHHFRLVYQRTEYCFLAMLAGRLPASIDPDRWLR